VARELTLITGEPGSGKTYWCVKLLVEETLPFYEDLRVVTNVPLFLRPEWQERVTVIDFEAGWLPPGDTLDEQLEYLRKTIIIIDEAHKVFNRHNEATIVSLIGLARKRDTQWILMSQSKKNLPDQCDDLAALWIECLKGSELRDEVFGFRIGDIQNLKAKLTGRYREFFQKTEYQRINRRWSPLNKKPYREWFIQDIGDCYDTKNGADFGDDGRATVRHDYQRFKWPTLLYIVGRRNAHVVPYFLFRNGSVLGFLAFGGIGLWYSSQKFGAKPRTPVVTVAERVKLEERAKPVVAAPVAPLRPAAAPVAPVVRRVVTWLLLLAVVGCRGPGAAVSEGPAAEHHARADGRVEPRVAAFGGGHSLDGLLGDAGIKSSTGLQVDGPLVGREVLDAARGAGYSLKGDTLVPARKRVVPVPQELGEVDGAANVGGYQVKLVSEDEVDRWRDMSAVVHEAYRTELCIMAVSASTSRDLSAIVSGQGNLTVSQPVSANPFSGKISVALALNGNVVTGRQIARPVLTSAPGASADVHVGQRIPVRLTTSTVTNQTTSTLGSSIQYIQTGTQVSMKPTRVSASQIRLAGNVTISEQTATIDGVPSTAERSLSVDHLVVLDSWTVLGRLDSASVKTSKGWLALGNFKATSDETFVVVGKVIQVHRDERTHVDKVSESDLAKPVEIVPPPVNLTEKKDMPVFDGPKVEKPAESILSKVPLSFKEAVEGKPKALHQGDKP
jgi:hypothetical protein